MNWEAVIGLEVHVQLATASKIFSDCPLGTDAEPNNYIDPVSTGQPGVLPVLNQRAVELAVRAALALDCTLNRTSIFARKHYFYPDLPKAYQISQYDRPYAEYGKLEIAVAGQNKRIGITRIHMEEDAGKNTHGSGADAYSYVDFNRAGAPLIEIVSEPDLRSAEEAGAYLRELHRLIRAIEASDADMEKGNFRCDANVSVRPAGQVELGTRTELKNINSFRFVEKAIAYEIERQVAVIEGGDTIIQQTRLWDAQKGRTFAMRNKEEAHDYRYFPDPDLPPLVLSEALISAQREALPELPQQRKQRFMNAFGLPMDDADTLVNDRAIADYFEAVSDQCKDPKQAANWVLNEVLAVLDGSVADFSVSPERLAGLLALITDGTISGKIAKEIFARLQHSELSALDIVEQESLAQISDDEAIEALVKRVLADHPDEVARFRGGEQKLMGFFMGQIMKAGQGKVNPGMVQQILRDQLGGT